MSRCIALLFLQPRHLDGVGVQHHAPAALPPGKTRYPLYRRLGRPQGRSGRVRKISPPPGFDPRTVQPVASRYADWAIPAHPLNRKLGITIYLQIKLVTCDLWFSTLCWFSAPTSKFYDCLFKRVRCDQQPFSRIFLQLFHFYFCLHYYAPNSHIHAIEYEQPFVKYR